MCRAVYLASRRFILASRRSPSGGEDDTHTQTRTAASITHVYGHVWGVLFSLRGRSGASGVYLSRGLWGGCFEKVQRAVNHKLPPATETRQRGVKKKKRSHEKKQKPRGPGPARSPTRLCSLSRQNSMALPTSLRFWKHTVFSSAYSTMSFSWWWKNSRIPGEKHEKLTPGIRPSSTAHVAGSPGGAGQRPEQGRPGFPLPGPLLQLFRGDPEDVPRPAERHGHPSVSWLSPGVSPPRGHLIQMPEPPPAAPPHVEGQHLLPSSS